MRPWPSVLEGRLRQGRARRRIYSDGRLDEHTFGYVHDSLDTDGVQSAGRYLVLWLGLFLEKLQLVH